MRGKKKYEKPEEKLNCLKMFEFTDRTILCIKVLNDLKMREKNEKLKKYLSLKTQMEKLSTFLILAQFQNF